ncbi:M20 family metallopeptidase [Metasolibacillus sp. FSL K6-0083]|uniref:M20 metallopeptidase family protein n=1 Tax=Metasolibacillus sp. FSL K6-0083 TaxID=2921416 RepID=UPI00315ACE19
MSLFTKASTISEEMISVRQHLHQHPELSNKEFETTKLVASYLSKWGIPYTIAESGTGVVGFIEAPNATKTLALRADMDALPISEETNLPYKSIHSGIMHACGHDLHTSVLLGTAKMLIDNQHLLKANIKLLFQPAEEIMSGAKEMLQAGVLENPKVDAAIALHTSPDLSVGEIGIRYGAMLAACDNITITIRGTGGHAAHPHKSVDPILIAGHVLTSLQTIVAREIPPTEQAVVTIGHIQGGEAHNIIPESVIMKGTVRTTNPAIREQMPAIIERIIQHTAESMRGNASLHYEHGCPALLSDASLLQLFEQVTTELLGEKQVVHMPAPSMGGEDFSYILEQVPGFMFRMGTGSDNENTRRALHNHKVEFENEAIQYGIAAMVNFALTYGE